MRGGGGFRQTLRRQISKTFMSVFVKNFAHSVGDREGKKVKMGPCPSVNEKVK